MQSSPSDHNVVDPNSNSVVRELGLSPSHPIGHRDKDLVVWGLKLRAGVVFRIPK